MPAPTWKPLITPQPVKGSYWLHVPTVWTEDGEAQRGPFRIRLVQVEQLDRTQPLSDVEQAAWRRDSHDVDG